MPSPEQKYCYNKEKFNQTHIDILFELSLDLLVLFLHLNNHKLTLMNVFLGSVSFFRFYSPFCIYVCFVLGFLYFVCSTVSFCNQFILPLYFHNPFLLFCPAMPTPAPSSH